MELDTFSLHKRFVHVGNARVAYYEAGTGHPIVLVHGCPFSSFIWRKVIPPLSRTYRCLAPDLLGLGDTETAPGADWLLPAQAAMLAGFLDALGLEQVNLVGHDHGGALAQLIAAEQPERIDRLVLANCEAFDNWPSAEEKPFIILTQLPLLGSLVLWLWSFPAVLELLLAIGSAVKDTSVLTPELVQGYLRANLSNGRRRAKTRRFLASQLDPQNHRCTLNLLEGLRKFQRPTMIVWGQADPHFGSQWAHKLYQEIPGAVRLELLSDTGHLLMEEKPEAFTSLLLEFFSQTVELERTVASVDWPSTEG